MGGGGARRGRRADTAGTLPAAGFTYIGGRAHTLNNGAPAPGPARLNNGALRSLDRVPREYRRRSEYPEPEYSVIPEGGYSRGRGCPHGDTFDC